MIDFEYLMNPEKYHTVPPRGEGEKDEQYKARLGVYVQGIKSQQAKIDELQKKLDCCREENKALLSKLSELKLVTETHNNTPQAYYAQTAGLLFSSKKSVL